MSEFLFTLWSFRKKVKQLAKIDEIGETKALEFSIHFPGFTEVSAEVKKNAGRGPDMLLQH